MLFKRFDVVNSWLAYKKKKIRKKINKECRKQTVLFELADWKKPIAFSLIKTGEQRNAKQRLSSLERKLSSTRAKSFRLQKKSAQTVFHIGQNICLYVAKCQGVMVKHLLNALNAISYYV